MSYCRWSSMNWMCDLYCYEDVRGGFTTHVAGRRRAYAPCDDRSADFFNHKITAEEFTALHRQQIDELNRIPLNDIELPHAGESFNDETLEEFRDRLLALRAIGYQFPDHVLEEIADEIKERDHQNWEDQEKC